MVNIWIKRLFCLVIINRYNKRTILYDWCTEKQSQKNDQFWSLAKCWRRIFWKSKKELCLYFGIFDAFGKQKSFFKVAFTYGITSSLFLTCFDLTLSKYGIFQTQFSIENFSFLFPETISKENACVWKDIKIPATYKVTVSKHISKASNQVFCSGEISEKRLKLTGKCSCEEMENWFFGSQNMFKQQQQAKVWEGFAISFFNIWPILVCNL